MCFRDFVEEACLRYENMFTRLCQGCIPLFFIFEPNQSTYLMPGWVVRHNRMAKKE